MGTVYRNYNVGGNIVRMRHRDWIELKRTTKIPVGISWSRKYQFYRVQYSHNGHRHATTVKNFKIALSKLKSFKSCDLANNVR